MTQSFRPDARSPIRRPLSVRLPRRYGQSGHPPIATALAVVLVSLAQLAAACTSPHRGEQIVTPPIESTRTSQVGATTGTGLIAPDEGADDDLLADLAPSTGSPGSPPVAAALPWLAGPSIDDGILIDEADGQRWHGRNAREYAVIRLDGSYRYFGPDGSMTGCSPAGACVGIGADGTVAIVAAREQPRRVFAADGTDLGWFTAEGEMTSPPTDADGSESAAGESSVDRPPATGADIDGSAAVSTTASTRNSGAEPPAAGGSEGAAPDGASTGAETAATDSAIAADLVAATDLGSALAASGVDIAGLLNEGTLRPPFAGGVTGDPHIVTAGGMRFSTQDLGQYVARGGDDERQIQLEFGSMSHRRDVSIVTAVAVDTGSEIIAVTSGGVVGTDGSMRAPATSFDQIVMVDGVVIGRWPADETGAATVVIWFPDGSEVTAATHPALGITLVAAMPPSDQAVGLFGSGRLLGLPGQDLLPRHGRSASTARTVESWRVSATDRLFDEPAAVTGSSATVMVDPAATASAQQWCTGRGMTRSQDIDACVFDIAVTGDTAFVAGHLALAIASGADRSPGRLAQRWPALQAGPRAGASPLPADGRISTTLAEGSAASYRLTMARSGPIVIVNESGCAEGAGTPGIDERGLRLFDASGHAVSDRAPWCGHLTSDRLPEGEYLLVAANGQGQAAAQLRVDVQLP